MFDPQGQDAIWESWLICKHMWVTAVTVIMVDTNALVQCPNTCANEVEVGAFVHPTNERRMVGQEN